MLETIIAIEHRIDDTLFTFTRDYEFDLKVETFEAPTENTYGWFEVNIITDHDHYELLKALHDEFSEDYEVAEFNFYDHEDAWLANRK